MSTAELFKSFANECFRWATEADQGEFRRTCLEMAKMWTQLAALDSHGHLPDRRKTVRCVKCSAAMTPSEPKPIRSSGLKEIAYVCPSCGAVTKRFMPGPEFDAKRALVTFARCPRRIYGWSQSRRTAAARHDVWPGSLGGASFERPMFFLSLKQDWRRLCEIIH